MVNAMSEAASTSTAPASGESENIKETLQSILIAFILAFVFRSFFVEAFVIPTGSMAPTLLGKHVRFQSPPTGFDFAVNPRDNIPGTEEPTPIQRGISVTDPMSGEDLQSLMARTRSGDRILVLKYIYAIFQPQRFDVIVFKNPNFPAQNYIKRLIGLAGEDVWLVDGDVFARPNEGRDALEDGWSIQRKPVHVQREVWQPVYYSEHRPLNADQPGVTWHSPWKALSGEWEIGTRPGYLSLTRGPASLVFEPEDGITDYTIYDQTREHYARIPGGFFNVSDIRVAAGVKPGEQNLQTTIEIDARGHEFQALVAAGEASVRMRRRDAEEWTVLESVPLDPFTAERITNVEFWHVDQSLSLWIDGRRVAYGEYDWQPDQRLHESIGLTGLEIRETESLHARRGEQYNALLDQRYVPEPARVIWSFEGSPVDLYRVQVDRDLYYRPANYPGEPLGTGPGLATHPNNIARLDHEEYFACGDNSALSHDARLWGPPDDWVASRIDPDQGIVNEKMLLGKAFFVYWPSMQPFSDGGRLLVPDFGRMRFIR